MVKQHFSPHKDYSFMFKNGFNPCKIFTEISPRLARSRRDRRDLVEIDEISPRLQRSRQDLAMIFVGF